jgi:hypothetical protein
MKSGGNKRARAAVVCEIAHIQLEAAVLDDGDESAHLIDVLRAAIGSHAHDFVLTLIDLEPQVRREGAIQQAQRMRVPYFVGELQVDPAVDTNDRAGSLANAGRGSTRGVGNR